MPIELLGVGTDRLPGRFQLPTPNNSIGPSEVARDGFKARPPVFVIERRGFQTNRSCLSLSTVSPGSGSVSRCVRRGSGASICAGSPGTGLPGTGGGSPIRGVPCLVICAEAETAMLTTPVVGLFVGIDAGRQVTLDQHHGLSPRRSKTMCRHRSRPNSPVILQPI